MKKRNDNRQVPAEVLVREARQHLLGIDGITEAMIDAHMTDWQNHELATLPDLYREMIMHATNRQMMPKVIGDVDRFRKVLEGFDPKRINARFAGDHVAVLRAIKSSGIKTAGKVKLNHPRGLWALFAKSVVSCAAFLARFESAEEFKSFVRSFYVNEHSKLALPLLLKEELDGFGFALACDFLKESGYPEFVKPDVHLIDIARAAGISRARSDYETFKDVVAYCQQNGLRPYELDKLLWLCGSGNFHLSRTKVVPNKKKFLQRIAKLRD